MHGQIVVVVYFEKQMGACHAVHQSKVYFMVFSGVSTTFKQKIDFLN